MPNVAEYDFQSDPELSPKWKKRFAFFEEYGLPGFWVVGKRFQEGLKTLGFWGKRSILFNWWAIFPGIYLIYLFYLGLWKKAIVVLAYYAIVPAVLDMISPVLSGISVFSIFIIPLMRTNIYYYQFKVKGIDNWSL